MKYFEICLTRMGYFEIEDIFIYSFMMKRIFYCINYPWLYFPTIFLLRTVCTYNIKYNYMYLYDVNRLRKTHTHTNYSLTRYKDKYQNFLNLLVPVIRVHLT